MNVRTVLSDIARRLQPGPNSLVLHFDLRGGPKLTLLVADGRADVHDGWVGEATCRIRSSVQVLLDVIDGRRLASLAIIAGDLMFSDLTQMVQVMELGIIPMQAQHAYDAPRCANPRGGTTRIRYAPST
ncbi:MAG: SCP2 sterol-binding domain-containing protein [Deltaproteobacteria bacterium]|nr:SCP2 sterol-binding domain-containing protein [Deltaproteobacteria bacterium]